MKLKPKSTESDDVVGRSAEDDRFQETTCKSDDGYGRL